MRIFVAMLAIVSMALIATHPLIMKCESAPLMATDVVQAVPLVNFKRSLCNTFGGCGSKRSTIIPPVYTTTNSIGTGSGQQQQLQTNSLDNPLAESKREVSAALINEAINDLTDYLQSNENYLQGKLIVLVQKPYNDRPLGRNSVSNAINRDVVPDLQELSLGRLFVKRNE